MMDKHSMIAFAVGQHLKQEVHCLQRLVQTNSVNGFLSGASSPDTPVEKVVAVVIQQELLQLGLEPEHVGISPERPNV